MMVDEHVAEARSTTSVAPYGSPHEHLSDLLRRHVLLLKRLIARSPLRKVNDVLGFVAIGEDEVRRLLDDETSDMQTTAADISEIDRALAVLQTQIDARVEQSRVRGVRLPFVELAEKFTLTTREVDLLFACFAVELDRRLERVHGYLHDDMSRKLMSTGIAIGLLCDDFGEQVSARFLLGPNARLRHYRLLEMTEDASSVPWLSRLLRTDERTGSFLTGDAAVDSRIVRHVVPFPQEPASLERGARDETVKRMAQRVRALHATQKSLVYLQGTRQAGADTQAYAIARQLDVELLAIDVESMLDPSVDFEAALFLIFRESMFGRDAIYLRNLDRALEQPNGTARYRTLLRCLADMGRVAIASGETPWCWELPSEPIALQIVELKPPSVDEQLSAWQSATHRQFSDGELHRLISLHPLPAAGIRDVWRMAKTVAMSNDHQSQPTLEQVQQACRIRAGAPASSMARRLEPKNTWSDLVLPAVQLEQLQAVCAQARHASIVFGSWCFDRKMSLGRGLNALFSGPPGTGKTMAAEVLAAELCVEILKIDLSQVVSKYIGETEKNLRQLFDQAAGANAILFFDEADALLGKRSAVKDAHDRYANTETAYLLQKMEEYPGITVLSTNLRQNMDEAFTRRMRFVVDFPFPEEADRLRIWRTVWPKEVPLDADVDLPALARQFRLAGGSIRNVALSAAFLAADQGGSVSMQHLLRATKRELQKMGRLVNEEELRRHA